MDLTTFDHILVATLFLVIPVFSVTDYRKLESRLDAGLPTARLLFYRSIIAWSWGLAIAVAALWLVYERGIRQLGLGVEPGWRLWSGLAIAIVVCGLFIAPLIAQRRDPEKARKATASQFESVKAMIPRTDREAKEFSVVSITAGVCEEIVYRGYLMVYFASALAIGGMWAGALLSSLAFGLAHTYQGPKGVLKTGLLGLVMAGFYMLSGSVWLLIVVHTVVDLVSGRHGRAAFAIPGAAPETD